MTESIINAPFELSRFVLAQEDTFDIALSEVRSGRKSSHWMWFIFPNFAVLVLVQHLNIMELRV